MSYLDRYTTVTIYAEDGNTALRSEDGYTRVIVAPAVKEKIDAVRATVGANDVIIVRFEHPTCKGCFIDFITAYQRYFKWNEYDDMRWGDGTTGAYDTLCMEQIIYEEWKDIARTRRTPRL